MKNLKVVLAVSILLLPFMGSAAYGSDGATVAHVQQPNLYELRGMGIHIKYSTSSLAGPPILTYRDRERTLTFQGDEIGRLDSEIGQQVTVTIEEIPDLYTATFSLLLPMINLRERECRFRTIGIMTTHRTSVAGPEAVEGALQTYRVKHLQGTAQLVNY